MSIPRYQYHVQTWGGFYNEDHKKTHGLEPGDYLFGTKGARDVFVNHRRQLEQKLNAKSLMVVMTEGFHCDVRTTLHRVVEYRGQQHYSTSDMGVNYPLPVAKYHLENKWYPGFNDYPLGEDFDYSSEEVITVKEWITGAFDLEELK